MATCHAEDALNDGAVNGDAAAGVAATQHTTGQAVHGPLLSDGTAVVKELDTTRLHISANQSALGPGQLCCTDVRPLTSHFD